MKIELSSLLLAALIPTNSAADAPPPQTAPKPQPAKITAVAPAEDKRTLVIRYEIEGRPAEERITFGREIADFRCCPWRGDSGIAIVARIGAAEATEYFF